MANIAITSSITIIYPSLLICSQDGQRFDSFLCFEKNTVRGKTIPGEKTFKVARNHCLEPLVYVTIEYNVNTGLINPG